MKKFLAGLVAAAALACGAFQVVEVSPLKGGEFAAPGNGGKLVGVEVFAPTNGTVALSRVWEGAVFTNAVVVDVNAVTNVDVAYSNRLAATSYTASIVVTNGVTTITNKALGTVSVVTNTSVVSTNFPLQVVFTNTYAAAGFTLPGWSNANPAMTLLSVSTNEVFTATTNTAPVFAYSVAVTNDLVSGTASSNVFTNAPAAPVYLAPGERLIFSGTATGGFLRLILE